MSDQYFVEMDGEDRGPFTIGQLRAMWSTGKLTGEMLFAQPGSSEWKKLSTITALLEPAPPAPPPPPPPRSYEERYQRYDTKPMVVRTAKSRGTYIILGLLFGCLGLHNFYAGRNGQGAAQLIITLLLGWVIIGIVLTVFWSVIEIITIDVDGDGQKMV